MTPSFLSVLKQYKYFEEIKEEEEKNFISC
jgi:hypothetical protein